MWTTKAQRALPQNSQTDRSFGANAVSAPKVSLSD
jgi:hypothetical protein